MGVRQATVTAWRNGYSRAEGENLADLARLLQVSERELLGDDTPNGALVREGVGSDAYMRGVIAGQARAVRQMLAAALEEQDRLIVGLDRLHSGTIGVVLPTPNATPEALEAATARQHELDAAAARAKARGA